MTKYQCENCNYIFELKEGKRLPKKCPYCSKESSMGKIKTAQQLIDEVAKEFPDDDE